MITVNVQGFGSFQVDPSKLAELLQWLKANGSQVVSNESHLKPGQNILHG